MLTHNLGGSKVQRAQRLGIARSTLYYQRKQEKKDWDIKVRITDLLQTHPSYGHRRLALALRANTKRIRRVMRLFHLKPSRRRVRKPKRSSEIFDFPAVENLLLSMPFPQSMNIMWVSDFTHIWFRNGWLYLATIMDLFSREIVGWHCSTAHRADLVIGALAHALDRRRSRPLVLHSDQGSEYLSRDYMMFVRSLGIVPSTSRKASPWENGYQESFYSQFKLDLGDPSRFESLGELVAEIYRLIRVYNEERIHSALRMPPQVYATLHSERSASC